MGILKFIQDPMWQFWGAVLALIAIVVALFDLKLRRRRKLSYEILTSTSVVRIAEGIDSKISVLFDYQVVKSVSLIEVRLINNGNVEFRPEDFIEPVKIAFPREIQILSFEVTGTYPLNLKPMFSFNDGLTLEPLLLNPGEWIKIKILTSGVEREFRIFGRIAGVSNIGVKRQARKIDQFWLMVAAVVTGGFVSALIAIAMAILNPQFRWEILLIFGLIVTFIIAGFVFLALYFSTPKRQE